MTAMQLMFDGGEIAHPARAQSSLPPLRETQREIVAYARLHGGLIRSFQAGVIIHRSRMRGAVHEGCIEGPCDGHYGCCQWASGDGGDALKRLAKRGTFERVGVGLWVLAGS